MLCVTLPFPPAVLSPNNRSHWRHKAKTFAAHKTICRFLCLEAEIRDLPWCGASLRLTFCPPSRRTYDADNLVARGKALIDGIAAASGIDDSRFELTVARGCPVKGGAVLAEISPL